MQWREWNMDWIVDDIKMILDCKKQQRRFIFIEFWRSHRYNEKKREEKQTLTKVETFIWTNKQTKWEKCNHFGIILRIRMRVIHSNVKKKCIARNKFTHKHKSISSVITILRVRVYTFIQFAKSLWFISHVLTCLFEVLMQQDTIWLIEWFIL